MISSKDVQSKEQESGEKDSFNEEYIDHRSTGLELEEEDDESSEGPQPWDPDKIRVHTKHYSLRQLVDMIRDQDLDLAPDFQRSYVWKEHQRSGLIESLLLGIPVPSFYLNEEKTGKMQVVDGVQRLTTIYSFMEKKEFKLKNMTYLKALNGQGFSDLEPMYRRRLNTTQFVAHVIDPQTPFAVKFEVFKRINTGGTPLSAQEIRHCMSLKTSREFLKALADDTSFITATGGALQNHPRLADREVVLRFVAFSLHTVDDYAKSQSLDDFLGMVTQELEQMKEPQLAALKARFQKGMNLAYELFGAHCFRRWPIGSERRAPINRALVETWGPLLSLQDPEKVRARKVQLVAAARELMTSESHPDFVAAIVGSTGSIGRVRTRFEKVQHLVKRELE